MKVKITGETTFRVLEGSLVSLSCDLCGCVLEVQLCMWLGMYPYYPEGMLVVVNMRKRQMDVMEVL